MSEQDSSKEESTGEKTAKQSSSSNTGCNCKTHTSLYISVAALLLSGYALFSANSGHDNSGMQAQLNSLDNKISNIDGQLITLNDQVQSNREKLVQTQLKKALENIREISDIAEEGTKAAISEVEEMLQSLTNLNERFNAPAEIEETAPTDITPEAESAPSQIEAIIEGPVISQPAPGDLTMEETETNSTAPEAEAADEIIEPQINRAPAAAPSTPQAL